MNLPMLQWPEEVAMFGELLAKRSIKTVLEIGTGPGGLTQWLGRITCGRVVSIDLPNGSSTGMSLDACEARNRVLSESNPEFVGILGNSRDVKTFRAAERALDGEADLLFIDGDHSWEGLEHDFAEYGALVRRPGGLIAFHDINADAFASHGVDVPRFWRSLGGVKQELTVRGDWGGIGVLFV
jgi:predicted O-methyltransferase YrrM